MDKEIKERIAAINSGIIPEGYKKTKVGIVPVEWEEMKLEEISDYITKGATPTTYGFTWLEEGIPFFRNDSIKNNTFIYGDFSYISEEANKMLNRSEVKRNDIVIAITGDIGKVGMIPDEIEKANINQHLARIRIIKKTLPYFVYQFLSSDGIQKVYKVIKTGISMPQLSLEQIRDTLIILPPLLEQQKIAEILSTQDKLIELQEKKIEQLKELKKAYLQKMFPKKGSKYPELRFKGFTDPWEQRKLGEVCQINGRIGFRGYTEKDIIPKEQGGVLAFTPTNIVNNQLALNVKNTYITREKYDESPEIIVKNGNILFVKTGSTLGKSALVTGFNEDSTVNPQVVVIKTGVSNQKILSTILTTDKVQSQVASVKIGGAVPTMTETELKNIELSMPVNADERIRIGTFFTELDSLITLHQRKSEQEKQKKKALMQLLLTGIVRTK